MNKLSMNFQVSSEFFLYPLPLIISSLPKNCEVDRRILTSHEKFLKKRRRGLLPGALVDFGERGIHHIPHDLQAARARLIQRVVSGVPWWVIKVDQIDCRNPGFEEWHMIIFDLNRIIQKLPRESHAPCRRPDDVGQPAGGTGLALDVEVFVADHVDKYQSLQIS